MSKPKEGVLQFNEDGRLVGVSGVITESLNKGNKTDQGDGEEGYVSESGLKKSSDLAFLEEDEKFEKVVGEIGWSLHEGDKFLKPITYSDGKSQKDTVKEIVDLIKGGQKIIFLYGVCGTGKSAVALNIARELGRASIVVPVKALQRQYEEDYMGKKYVVKKNGKKMKIAMITGRDNHDSIIMPGMSCADPFLPDTIKFTEKNAEKIREFYDDNPLIKNKIENLSIRELKRISIAPSNPYWSPIVSADVELRSLKDAVWKRYKGLDDKEFIFYHRKRGCSYYDQYQAYLDADVLIFNSAKYKIECMLNRKPSTEIEIIDEGDEFLDSFSTRRELNLVRLMNALNVIVPDFAETEDIIDEIKRLIKLEDQRARAIGVDENQIFSLGETKIEKILKLFLSSSDLQSELVVDEMNYGNHAVDVARDFEGLFGDTYLTYRYVDTKADNTFDASTSGMRKNCIPDGTQEPKVLDESKKHQGFQGEQLIASLVSTNLSKQFKDIVDKNKALVLMSGTIHSDEVLRDVFGLKDYCIVNAETKLPGQIEIVRSGKEFDCKYATFKNGFKTREDYLLALEECLAKSVKPVLVQVNAFEDLPSEEEVNKLGLVGVMYKERLNMLQKDDKTGRLISLFKTGVNDSLFSTKCSRGVDFPGDVCRSVIFTKYPNPNVRDVFWKVLEKNHSEWFWEFYKDKARREFLQRLYRAVRSPDDWVKVLSPDTRVLDAVGKLQRGEK